MNMIKKIAVIITALASMLGAVSCADISLGGSGDGYSFVVTNATGGVLESIVIDATTFSDVQPDATCEVVYNARPVEKEVTYNLKQVNGFGESVIGTGVVTVNTTAASESHNHDLVLNSSYAAVWVENISETTGRDIDLVGIGDGGTITGTGDLTDVADYQGVTGEEIAYTDLDNVSGSIASTTAGYFSVYATVTGEELTHDVTGEDPSDGTLDNNSSSACDILKKSVALFDGATEIARDDGNNNLVSTVGALDTSATNTVSYTDGAISYTIDAGYVVTGSITVEYTYFTAFNLDLQNTPKEGSIVIKMGSEVIASEELDGSVYTLTGDKIISNMSEYDYTTSKLTVFLGADVKTTDEITAPITIQYDYQVFSDDDGDGTIDGSDTRVSSQTGTIDYATGIYTSLFLDAAYFSGRAPYAHTVTALYASYHTPYVKAIADNITDAVDSLSTPEALVFDAATRSVEVYLANRIVDPGSVSIKAVFDDASTTEVIITDDGSGVLNSTTPAGVVGNIDYNSGKVKFSLPDATYVSGATLVTLTAEAYDYQTVVDSTNKTFAGFVETDDISSGKGFYVLDMNGPSTLAGYWRFTDFDFLYDTNSAGSTVLNLVCGPNGYTIP